MRYRRPPNRLIIEEYDIDDFRSGPFETKGKLDEVDQKISTFTSLVFVILAILMAAIGFPYLAGSQKIQPDIRLLDVLTLFFSALALIFSFFSWRVRLRLKIKAWVFEKIKAWVFLTIIIGAIGIIVAVAIYFDLLSCLDDSAPWLL